MYNVVLALYWHDLINELKVDWLSVCKIIQKSSNYNNDRTVGRVEKAKVSKFIFPHVDLDVIHKNKNWEEKGEVKEEGGR